MIFVTILLTILKITGPPSIIDSHCCLFSGFCYHRFGIKEELSIPESPISGLKRHICATFFQGILYWMRMEKRRILKYSGKE